MFRVLLLPLLQIPSGHQHVADSIMAHLEKTPNMYCEKIELLSHCYGTMEQFISSIYLQTINKIPKLYSSIYRLTAEDNVGKQKFRIYEWFFLKKMLRIIHEKNPDLIICTHSFPSYLLNQLKKKKQWNGKAINIYTDYFINNHWGISAIDYHFVPCPELKQLLIQHGIKEENIFVTGIPVHPQLMQKKNITNHSLPIVLITGGSMGTGGIKKLLQKLQPRGKLRYKVLCGKNKHLFHFVVAMNHPLIEPLSYISSKEEMNSLYDEATCILTKPGGVTVSECLRKKVPIIIYEALPGQEEFNLHYLKRKNLVYHLADWKTLTNIEDTLLKIITLQQNKLIQRYNLFQQHLETMEINDLIQQIIS